MQINSFYIIIFACMMIVTILPRVLPLTILSKLNLPKFIIDVLEYIPVAILGALLFPTILMINGKVDISLNNLYLIAAIITGVISLFTKKLVLIVVAGIFAMYLLINFL